MNSPKNHFSADLGDIYDNFLHLFSIFESRLPPGSRFGVTLHNIQNLTF